MTIEDLAVALARVEGKLDGILSQLQASDKRGDDHEARLRLLEQKPVVTTRAIVLWVTTVAAGASAVPVLLGLYR